MALASIIPFVCLLGTMLWSLCTAQNVDGGRSELPGMRQDMFDQVNKQKKMGGHDPRKMGKIPECPRSDKMSPFYGLAFTATDMYVKVDSTEGKCQKLLTVNGANYTELLNMSRTCGPPGEYKKRVAEELSAMFFQGGFDWVKNENDTVEVITSEGTFQLEVNEAKYQILEDCWKSGCECEQVKNPAMRAVLYAILSIAISGLFLDSGKNMLDWWRGKKPPKRVECKKGHRVVENAGGKFVHNHHCDICGCRGTYYACSDKCCYDMCKKCYKETKKKVKATWAVWLEKHPEDKKAGKDKEDDDEDKEKSGDDTEKSGDSKAGEKSEPESGTEAKTSEGGSREDDDEDKAKSETSGDKDE